VVYADLPPVSAGGLRFVSVAFAWIAGSSPAMTKERTERTNEKRFGGETPTDAMVVFCRADGHGRVCKRQAHIYRRSTAESASSAWTTGSSPAVTDDERHGRACPTWMPATGAGMTSPI